MEQVERPSPVLVSALNYDFCGLADAAIWFDSCIPQILESRKTS